MNQAVQSLSSNLNLGSFKFDPTNNTFRAVAIVALLFLLVLTLAKVRRDFVHWSFKGAIVGIFFGFLLALILEGFLIIGGKTAITEVLGWKNAPKPIQVAVDSGRTKLTQVLGAKDQIPQSYAAETPTADDAVKLLQSLDPTEVEKAKSLICEP